MGGLCIGGGGEREGGKRRRTVEVEGGCRWERDICGKTVVGPVGQVNGIIGVSSASEMLAPNLHKMLLRLASQTDRYTRQVLSRYAAD